MFLKIKIYRNYIRGGPDLPGKGQKCYSQRQKQRKRECAIRPVSYMIKTAGHFYQLLINGNRYVSCDYGTQNATVFLLWNKGTNGKWYCIREYYYSGRDKGKQKTDSEYADDLKEWLDGTKIKAIIVDPSAASFIAELRKRGYKVLKANNDVLDGIRLVGMLLNLEKIVFASSCKETIKEFASYIWDEKALERGEDKPVKQFDHCCDAVRYLCSTIIGRKAARFREIRR